MVAAIISLLIWTCVVGLVIYLVIWVLKTVIGVPLPEKVIQILWVIFALVVLLMIVNLLLGSGSLPRISIH